MSLRSWTTWSAKKKMSGKLVSGDCIQLCEPTAGRGRWMHMLVHTISEKNATNMCRTPLYWAKDRHAVSHPVSMLLFQY